MDRQSSLGSESSAGSAFSGRSAATSKAGDKGHGGPGGGGGAEELQQEQQLKKALFGALYTLAKEKINDTPRMAYITIMVDFLLIFGLFMQPEYPWALSEHNPLFKVFFYVEFHLPIAHTGLRLYLIVFYVLVATLFVSAGICVWVGWCFKNDSFPFLWPIKVARIVVSLFVSMFYIASLNIFLIAIQCKPEVEPVTGHRHWKHLIYHLNCMSMPHVIHGAFSVVSSVLFFIVALLLVVADHELEPMSRSLLAAPHSMCELRMLLCKTVITFCDILLRPAPHIQVVMYAAACVLMLWYQIRWGPHLSAWINCFRAGLNAVLAWVAVMLMAMTYSVHWHENDSDGSHSHYAWAPWSTRRLFTLLMVGGIPLAFSGGMAAMYARLYYAWRTALKFARMEPGVKPRSVHEFWDDFDVEVAARIGRVFDVDGANFDPGALDCAENVLKAGVAMWPESPYLRIVYSNFLIEVRKSNGPGWSQLEMARKLEPNLSYQFSIFTREQEHKQQAAAGNSGEQAVDLVSYVEFQKNYRSLMEYHKAALEATRDFWRLVMRDVVPVASLSTMFARIDLMEGAANRTYRLVLDRYPHNAKLLRSYGRFLENVKNDPWVAAKYYAEAEKQEELAATAAPEISLEAGEDGETNARLLAAIANKDNAVITINASGIIQTANKAATKMLAYKKGELEGKNVSVIMPPPYSTRHNSYMKAYLTTGKAHVLDETVEVVALTKERLVIPITLTVTKASGAGADAIFMGILKPATTPAEELKVWLLPTGVLLAAHQSFTDYAGWGPVDLIGKPFSAVAAEPSELESFLSTAARASAAELKHGIVSGPIRLKHKFGGQVPVSLRVILGGSDSQRLLVVMMRRLEEGRLMMAVDHKGRLVYANTGFASLLGYKLPVLKTKELGALLPPPYNSMHTKWLKEAESLDARQVPGSCRAGATVHLASANGTAIPVKATITHHPGTLGQPASWAVAVTRSSEAAAADERRLLLRVSADGAIVSASRGTPTSLFGLDPARLVGAQLDAVVDAFHHHAKAGNSLGPALTALLMFSNAHPGSSWRVGAGRVEEAEAEAAARAAATAAHGAESPRSFVRQASRQGSGKVRAAIMVVSLTGGLEEEEEVGDDGGGGADGGAGDGGWGRDSDGAMLSIELWRADLTVGLVELGPGCTIVRADAGVGHVFGVNPAAILQHHLFRYVSLPQGTPLEELMGISSAKKGGLKKAQTHKVGPRHQLSARHSDGQPLAVTLQPVLKDGSSLARLVAVVKPAAPAKGSPGTLEGVIAAVQTAAMASGADDHGGDSGSEGFGTQAAKDGAQDAAGGGEGGLPGRMGGVQVPALPLGQAALMRGEGEGGAPTTRRGIQRPSARDPATARGVELDVGGTHGGEDGAAAARGMDVSDDGSGAAAAEAGRGGGGGRGHHLTEEEREAAMAAKGRDKARAWLESGFSHAVEDESAVHLPGAIGAGGDGSGEDGGSGGGSSENGPTAAKGGDEDNVGGGGGGGPSAQNEGASSAGGSEAGHVGGDFARGKRLRKLLRILNSYDVVATLNSFEKRMLAMCLAVVLLHVAAFGVMMVGLSSAASNAHEVEHAGDLADALHRACSFARILEAAQRDYGYSHAGLHTYAALLTEQLDAVEILHQGIYLGFKGLKAIQSPALRSLWHDSGLNMTEFAATDVGGGSAAFVTSLFNAGELFVAAGRDVAHAATSGSTAPLANDTNWRFVMVNGPGTIYAGYLRSINLMVLRAQASVATLRTMVIALMAAEGIGVCVGSIVVVLAVLRTLMRHRAAMFSVFLAVPNTALRALANKSTNIGDEDEDSDDEEAKAAVNEAEAKKRQRKAAEQEDAAANGAAGGGDGNASVRRRVSIIGQRAGGTTAGATSMGKGALNLASLMSMGIKARRAALLGIKKLEVRMSEFYKLVWPFLLWGALVMVLYGTSLSRLKDISEGVLAEKLGYRVRIQADRVAFLVGEVALSPTPEARAAAQPLLGEEADFMQTMYSAHLFGGPTLPDSIADGSHDQSDGALFRSSSHATLLFRVTDCLRKDTAACAPEGTRWWPVTHAGVDAMVRRLIDEAGLLAMDNATAITPDDSNLRYAYTWTVGAWDLHDGLTSLMQVYKKDLDKAIAKEHALHVVLLVAAVASVASFVLLLFRPYLGRVRKEGRRTAELLVQLPQEVDVDTLVIALTGQAAAGPAVASNAAAQPGQQQGGGWPGQAWAPQPGAGNQQLMLGSMASGGGAGTDRFFTPRGQQGMSGAGSGGGGEDGPGDGGSGGGANVRRRFAAGRRVAPEDA